MRRILHAALCLLVSAHVATAQQFWEKKPWTQWDKKEVQRMLEDSPWAKSQTVTNVAVDVAGGAVLRNPVAARVKDRDYTNVIKITYTAQFRSVPLIRQALVRQLQLAKNYDALAPEQKKNFDSKTELFLAAGDPGQIVVYVGYESSIASYAIELQHYWGSQTRGTLAASVFLNVPGGRKLELQDYAPATGGFQLLFQRPSGALPDGDITLQFTSPGFQNIPSKQMVISFPMKKMVVSGAPVF